MRLTQLQSRAFIIVAACAILAANVPARATTTIWNLSPPSSGFWVDSENWNPQQVPGPQDDAIIDNGGTAVIGQGDPRQDANTVTIGSALAASGTLKIQGGILVVEHTLDLGYQDNTTATLEVSGDAQLDVLGTGFTGGQGGLLAASTSAGTAGIEDRDGNGIADGCDLLRMLDEMGVTDQVDPATLERLQAQCTGLSIAR